MEGLVRLYMVGINIITKTIKWIVGAFFASTILAVVAYRFVPVYVTPLMLIRVVENTFSDEYEVKWEHNWVPLKEMSSYSTALSSITGGRASFVMKFASYELVPADVQQKLQKEFEETQKNED